MWSLRGTLGLDGSGRSIIDRDVLISHLWLENPTDLFDAAASLMYADDILYGDGEAGPPFSGNVGALCAEFQARELDQSPYLECP